MTFYGNQFRFPTIHLFNLTANLLFLYQGYTFH